MNGQEPEPWSVRFRRERRDAWVELERLVERVERKGIRSLRADELARLPVLYRAAVSALGVSRASVLDTGLRSFLEALVARAYLVVYAPKRGLSEVLVPFLTSGFPAAVRAIRWHVLASAGLLLLGGAIAFTMVRADLDCYYLFVDSGMAQGRTPTASVEDLRRSLFATGGDDLLTFAAFLFTHNSSVGILTYSLGCALGVPVAILVLFNGLLLGAMTALFHERGLALEWWSWILPHGVTEMLAIVLCGAAGLAIAQTIVLPGRQSRIAGLAEVGRRVGGVVVGSVVMLLVAAMFEGVFRQIVQDVALRYVVAGAFAAAWCAYFVFAGRRRS